ncbi:MAG: hypothetical protein IPN44_08710 [Flavobacteriales bacterium]|nr:hypothetical protein [Flavobacteriales bacterium]
MEGNTIGLLVLSLRVTAYVLVVFAQYRMIRRVARGQMQAVVLSWLGWAMLMGISVVAQLQAQAWVWDWDLLSVLLSAVGCLFIGSTGSWTGNFSRGKGDVLCLLAGLACMAVYFLFSDPWITTALAITADLLVAIPMLQRAFVDPAGHRTDAWPIVLCAWTLTTASILFDFSWLHLLWPIYLIGFSGTMTYLTFFRRGRNSAHQRRVAQGT